MEGVFTAQPKPPSLAKNQKGAGERNALQGAHHSHSAAQLENAIGVTSEDKQTCRSFVIQ